MEKIKNIEFLRVFLILVIVFLHVAAAGSFALSRTYSNDVIDLLKNAFMYGNNAVEGFFIVAGFLLFITFKPNQNVKDFIKKKFIRLSPVILFTIILCWIFRLFNAIKVNFVGDILTVFLLNNFGICISKGSLPVLWYSSALFAGLLIYFGVLKLNKNKQLFLLVLFPIIAYGILEFFQHGNFSLPHKNYMGIFNVGFLRSVGGIGVGILIGYLYKICKDKIKFNNIVAGLAELLLLGFVIWWLCIPHEKFNCILFVFAFALLLLLFAMKYGFISKILDKDFWVKLGKYQYSIYVTHSFVGKVLYKCLWLNSPHFIKTHSLFAVLFTIILMLFVGIFTYHMVELPCTKYLKEKFC